MRMQSFLARTAEVMPHHSVEPEDGAPNVKARMVGVCTAIPTWKLRIATSVCNNKRIASALHNRHRRACLHGWRFGPSDDAGAHTLNDAKLSDTLERRGLC